MISGNAPDIDPANNDTLAGVMQFAFTKLLQGANGVLPAQVISVSDDRTRVCVQIMIAVVTTSGAQITRPQIAEIPVFTMGGGNLFLSFPIAPGNLGWLVANDRDISLFLQTYKQTAPNTGRIKNFADAFFLPDIMTGYTINSEDSASAVLSSKDGSTRIAIHPSGIKITAGTVTIAGNAEVTGTFKADTTSELVGVATFDAGSNMSGTIVLTGLGTYPFVISP